MHGERRLASRSLDEYQTLVLCRCRGGCLSRKHFLDLRVSSLRDATACRGTRASTPYATGPARADTRLYTFRTRAPTPYAGAQARCTLSQPTEQALLPM